MSSRTRQVALGATRALLACAIVAACGGGPAAPSLDAAGSPYPGPSGTSEASLHSSASPRPMDGFCGRLDEVRHQLERFMAVPLRVANRGLLDEELYGLEATWTGLVRADREPLARELARPMRELSYRFLDVQLSVEDFRTTPRPSVAAQHVQRQGRTFAAALDAVAQLAGCPDR